MPKIKTKRGVAKRLKVTGSGKLAFARSGKGHMNRRKSQSRLRNLRIDGTLEGNYAKKAKKMINGC